MFPNINKNSKGSVAITSVIAISSILLVAGITLTLTTADFAKSTRNYENRFQNEINADSCLEEAIYKLNLAPTYVGNVSITTDSGSCVAALVAVSGDPNMKDVNITSTFDNNVYEETHRIDISDSPPSIVY
jgi:hypothetical protein